MVVYDTEIKRVDEAKARFEAAKARLYRPDGAQVYGDAEHAERVTALVEQHFSVISRPVYEAAQAEEEKARAVIDTADRDPIFTAKAEDATMAGSLLPFLQTARTADLVEQATAAITAAARPAMLAIHHVLKRTHDDLLEQARVHGGRPDGRRAQEFAGVAPGLNALTSALKDPKADQRRQEAQKTLEQSRQLQLHINRQYTEITGGFERQRRDMARSLTETL